MDSSKRSTNQVLAVIITLTLLLAAAAAVLSSTQESKEYASDTPTGVVQLYLKALIEGKNEDATKYFSQTTTCDATDLDRTWIPETMRVNLKSSTIEGEKAFLGVAVDISSGGPFDDYYTENHTYRLARESGAWKILGIPWPLYSCDEVKS
ncbi:MAG: hypothetical protein EBZ85_00805 [Actinobacteria bacterium]|nr:hypothetical protein [Actinomycetota bacterium]